MLVCSSQHAFCMPCGGEAHGPCNCEDWKRWYVHTNDKQALRISSLQALVTRLMWSFIEYREFLWFSLLGIIVEKNAVTWSRDDIHIYHEQLPCNDGTLSFGSDEMNRIWLHLFQAKEIDRGNAGSRSYTGRSKSTSLHCWYQCTEMPHSLFYVQCLCFTARFLLLVHLIVAYIIVFYFHFDIICHTP